jgi:tetratricopeptide (TPR) repeat protein
MEPFRYTAVVKINTEETENIESTREIFLDFRDIDKFNKFINLALEYYKYIQDPDKLLTLIMNITTTLANLTEFDGEEEKFYEFLEYSEQHNLKGCKITLLLNLGKFYFKQENYEKSEELTHQALELALEDNIYRDICSAYYNLAVIYKYRKQYTEAIKHAKKSLEINQEINKTDIAIRNNLILGSLYYELGEFSDSYRYYSITLNLFRKILDHISKKELRDSYQENFKELPEILAQINEIIEKGEIYPDIGEIINLKEIGRKVCKKGKELFEDFNNQECKEQQKVLESKYLEILKKQFNEIQHILTEFNFTTVVKDFNEAIEIYDEDRRAPIPLIRNVLEGTIKGILRKIGKKPKSMRKNLENLENRKILKSTPENKQDPHIEVSTLYKIYGMLSNYGSHSTPRYPDITPNLFINTISWIHSILKRFAEIS